MLGALPSSPSPQPNLAAPPRPAFGRATPRRGPVPSRRPHRDRVAARGARTGRERPRPDDRGTFDLCQVLTANDPYEQRIAECGRMFASVDLMGQSEFARDAVAALGGATEREQFSDGPAKSCSRGENTGQLIRAPHADPPPASLLTHLAASAHLTERQQCILRSNHGRNLLKLLRGRIAVRRNRIPEGRPSPDRDHSERLNPTVTTNRP